MQSAKINCKCNKRCKSKIDNIKSTKLNKIIDFIPTIYNDSICYDKDDKIDYKALSKLAENRLLN